MNPSDRKSNIIFDLMRTLYDPETDMLVSGALRILEDLGPRHNLFLVSRDEGQRKDILQRCGIEHFFTDIVLCKEKNIDVYGSLIEPYSTHTTYIVGDYIPDEITLGNQLGYRTIWYQAGKFKDLVAKKPEEAPWRTITHLSQVTQHIA